MNSQRLAGALALMFGAAPALEAQDEDVTFFVIGKHATYRQHERAAPEPVDFSFFAEVFMTAGGDASEGLLTLPTGNELRFTDQREAEGGERDNILRISGKRRYGSFADLQKDYPDGEYFVSFYTASGPIHRARLVFSGGALPEPPRILPSQDGTPVCSVVDPDRDLQVRWSEFSQGGPDPNGVLDDLIFVILTRDDGMRVAHSGRPFENRPFLTFDADEFTIPSASLENGRDYVLSVEHAILDDTRRYEEVPAMTTRAVTTRMTISTSASDASANRECGPAESPR